MSPRRCHLALAFVLSPFALASCDRPSAPATVPTSRMVPAYVRSGAASRVTSADCPGRMPAARREGTVASRYTPTLLTTVNSGIPGAAISPREALTVVTVPSMGLVRTALANCCRASRADATACS